MLSLSNSGTRILNIIGRNQTISSASSTIIISNYSIKSIIPSISYSTKGGRNSRTTDEVIIKPKNSDRNSAAVPADEIIESQKRTTDEVIIKSKNVNSNVVIGDSENKKIISSQQRYSEEVIIKSKNDNNKDEIISPPKRFSRSNSIKNNNNEDEIISSPRFSRLKPTITIENDQNNDNSNNNINNNNNNNDNNNEIIVSQKRVSRLKTSNNYENDNEKIIDSQNRTYELKTFGGENIKSSSRLKLGDKLKKARTVHKKENLNMIDNNDDEFSALSRPNSKKVVVSQKRTRQLKTDDKEIENEDLEKSKPKTNKNTIVYDTQNRNYILKSNNSIYQNENDNDKNNSYNGNNEIENQENSNSFNQEKKNEINISHIRSILAIFERRPEDLIKLYIDSRFYKENKVELKPLMKHFVDSSKTYKILEDEEESEQTLRKVSGTIHHGGICAVTKKKYCIPTKELFDKEIEKSNFLSTSSFTNKVHSFSSQFPKRNILNQIKLNSLGSGSKPVVLLLDGVENPQNIGAIIRGAVLFGVESVIFVNEFNKKTGSINPYSAECYRSSRGAVEYCNISQLHLRRDAAEVLDEFIENGWEVVTTASNKLTNGDDDDIIEQQSSKRSSTKNISLYSDESNRVLGLKPIVLVLGSESKGISKTVSKKSTFSISIPGTGLIESLNVSQASSIILGECWRIQARSLEKPNIDRVKQIRTAGIESLEISPKLLGIKESEIYKDEHPIDEQEEEDEQPQFEQEYQEEYEQQQQQQKSKQRKLKPKKAELKDILKKPRNKKRL
ncbi:hypothetical protein ACTFIU_008235 [Dictyostelium citrinum]